MPSLRSFSFNPRLMGNPTKIPLCVFFILTALTSTDSSGRTLDQVAPPAALSLGGPLVSPSPQPQVIVGPSPDPTTTTTAPSPTLSFFMHDILGGSHPSGRVVTGMTPTAKTEATGGIPFSKPNNNIFPIIPGGVPLISTNKNNQPPSVTAGVQRQAFGSVTTIDDELTEGEDLGSRVIGRAQGFYFISSFDGSTHTVALTLVLLHPHNNQNDHKDQDYNDTPSHTISFFGVHRRVSPESPIAVVGGTGNYGNARGFAVIETLRRRENQQYMTDGADTILHFTVYLSN